MKRTLIALGTILISASVALAENFPLPDWTFSGGGQGNSSGSSAGPTAVFLNVFHFASGSGNAFSIATSSNSILTVTSNTTYQLSTLAKVNGPGYGSMSLLVNGAGAASTSVPSTGINVGSSLYTTSFTTGGPGDARVGLSLRAQFEAGSSIAGGGANTSFTNITMTATTVVPQLAIRSSNPNQVLLSWSTNYGWYVLESATNVSASIWSPVTNAAAVEGTNLIVTLDEDTGKQFFRLRQP